MVILKSKEDYIQAYEKEYRKTNLIFYGIGVIGIFVCLLSVYFLMIYDKSLLYYCIPVILTAAVMSSYRKRSYINNINKITDIFRQNLDIEFTLDIYKQLMNKKKRKDYAMILIVYLNLLVTAGHFDEFIEVYKGNRKVLRKISMDISLKSLQEKFEALKSDNSQYKKMLFAHRFTKYHNREGRLSKSKSLLKLHDKSYEVRQLYEIKEYQKAIDEIEKMHSDNPYDELLYRSYKERCLYHLQKNYSIPDEKYYSFLCVTQWKNLVETGEEYVYEKAEEILAFINQDMASACKKRKIWGIISILCMIILIVLLVIFPNEKKGHNVEAEYVADLKVWDYEVTDICGLCTNDDLTAAVVYAKKSDSESAFIYYLAGINYFIDGIMPKMALDIRPLFYLGGTTIYTSEGDESTYVVVATDELVQITYDGKVVKDIQAEKLSKTVLLLEPYVYCFMVEG